jgi:zinc D-Ala-D-Ala carboxypeptidase
VQVGRYFQLSEFEYSQTATRYGLDNSAPPEAREAICALCKNVLDPLRETLGRPIRITSGYRAPHVNRLVNGSRNSQHCAGEAADFKVEGMTPAQVFDFIRASDLPIDQCILEFGQWCHVSYSRNQRRGQFLIARRTEKGVQYSSVGRLAPSAIRNRITETVPVQAAPTAPRATAATPSASAAVAPPDFTADPLFTPAPAIERGPRVEIAPSLQTEYREIRQGQFIRALPLIERIKDALFGSGKTETQWATVALALWPAYVGLAVKLKPLGIDLPTDIGSLLSLSVAAGRLLFLRMSR